MFIDDNEWEGVNVINQKITTGVGGLGVKPEGVVGIEIAHNNGVW